MSACPVSARDDSRWATTWLNLHNPFFGGQCPPVLVYEDAYEHILDRHSEQPFDDLLGLNLADQFLCCRQPDLPASRRHAIFAACSRPFEEAVRTALREGLVLAYDTVDPVEGPLTTWLVVLNGGAVAVLRYHEYFLCLCSLFFPDEWLARNTLAARFTRVVGLFVSRYAGMDHDLNALVPPPPRHAVRINGEVRTNIRFGNLLAWGFAPELLGCPWRGRPIPLSVPTEGVKLRRRFRRPPRSRRDEA